MSIRQGVNAVYRKIEECQGQLDFLRSECKHQDTHVALWGTDAAHARMAVICKDCDTYISPVREEEDGTESTHN